MNTLLIIVFLVLVVGVLLYRSCSSSVSEKFIDHYYPGTEKPIDYSVYEIKDPKRYINVRVFKPGPNKESSLFGNFEKSERLPRLCEVIHRAPQAPWTEPATEESRLLRFD
jgi:hypothetical protein